MDGQAAANSVNTGAGRRNRRSGQMVIFVTLSLMFLFTVMGLAVDLGYSYFVKVSAQAAADSAASAAVIYANTNGYVCGSTVTCNTTYNCASPPTSPPTTPLQAGCLYANTNGFANTGSQAVSLIANNTTTPNESTNKPALWIQANVSQTVSHLFLYWAGFQSGSVAAQAIGGVTTTGGSSCVYALDTAATQDAIVVSGGAVLTTSGCGVYVNSSHALALEMTGGGKISAPQIEVHGNFGPNPCPITVCTSAAPTAGAAVVADPFLNVPAPTVPNTCYKTGYSLASSNTDTLYATDPSTGVVRVYCGGIDVTGSATLTMMPGTYIVNGGGFTMEHSGTVNGSGVTIFLTGQYGQTSAPMTLKGNSNTNLSAPDHGTYQGILFYQDRSTTYAGANTFSNSASMDCTGSFYFPTTTMAFSGSVAGSKIAMVVKDLSLSGSATFNQDTTGTYTGLATRKPGLIQ